MELEINNKIENKRKGNEEIYLLKKELEKSLNKNKFSSTIEEDFYNSNPLAKELKNKLRYVINECMKNMSYESDFYYFDFDNKKNKYYLNYYSNGKVDKIEMNRKEAKEANLKTGYFYRPYGDDSIVEANYIKDGLESDVDLALSDIKR